MSDLDQLISIISETIDENKNSRTAAIKVLSIVKMYNNAKALQYSDGVDTVLAMSSDSREKWTHRTMGVFHFERELLPEVPEILSRLT